MIAIVGFQLVAFAFFTKVFAIAEGLLPDDPKLTRVLKFFTLEKGLIISVGVFLIGIILLARAMWLWGQFHFGELPSMEENLRRLIPAATLVVLGIQGIFSSFFMSTLGLKTKTRKPPRARLQALILRLLYRTAGTPAPLWHWRKNPVWDFGKSSSPGCRCGNLILSPHISAHFDAQPN